MKNLGTLFLVILFITQCRYKEENPVIQFPGKPPVPSSIKNEHEYLLGKLKGYTFLPDSTGAAAKKLIELMQHHFKEEEDYALPPLGLLPLLTSGKIPENEKEIISLTEKLKSQLTHLNAEHQFIKVYLDELIQVAKKENHTEIIEFEKEIHQHASMEEEIIFPAAILVGEYLQLKSPAG